MLPRLYPPEQVDVIKRGERYGMSAFWKVQESNAALTFNQYGLHRVCI